MVFEQSGSRVKIWRAYGYGWRINYRVDNGTTYWVDVRKGIENGETPGIYGTSVSEGDFTFSIAQNFGTGIWNGKVNLKGQYRMKMTVCGDWSYTEGFTNVW
ncbi:hypothetical protein DMB66_54605 [Actinoplanes sp. ATCC 53533]|uniref:hypothetical protein n=1 Tax=Actinoplanes sp. ATCC 53533 TaxID=1288362 RepID=UPI000F7BAB9E|nr:hypothetical protein [Actinoplanes sp. ATCC 53533]RSM42594.1 hypothetical protein DMB66_54605 [Actinoplanes sp. ATCC 53533]